MRIKMKRIVFLILLLLISTLSQAFENNLAIGFRCQSVESVFGPKLSVKKIDADEATGTPESLFIEYEGAILEFFSDDKGFYLWRFHITSNDWSYNDVIKIGCSKDFLLSLLGVPESVEKSENAERIYYRLPHRDGWVLLKLVKEVVVEISASEDWS